MVISSLENETKFDNIPFGAKVFQLVEVVVLVASQSVRNQNSAPISHPPNYPDHHITRPRHHELVPARFGGEQALCRPDAPPRSYSKSPGARGDERTTEERRLFYRGVLQGLQW